MILTDALEERAKDLEGQRVVCAFLQYADRYHGTVLSVDYWDGANDMPVVTVKLDRQDEPVRGVVCFPQEPDIIKGNSWQCCWPETPTTPQGEQDGQG